MKKTIFSGSAFLLVLLSLCLLPLKAQSSADKSAKKYLRIPVAFYNQENLFDTNDDANADEEFLPNGANHWTQERYQQKLQNMSRVISQIGGGPAIIGMAEVENRHVLEDLIQQPALKKMNYKIVHYDSPDRRGIDCALLYQDNVFQLISSAPHPVVFPNEEYIKTRDILEVNGLIDGEHFTFIVAHWPSRYGGEQVSLPRRMAAAKVMRHVADSVLSVRPNEKIVMMGDLNDDPTSPSVMKGLELKKSPKNLSADEFYSPMYRLHRKGLGTLAYRDTWNLFDIMVINGNLVRSNYKEFGAYKDPRTGFYAFIFNKPFITQQSGRYKGYPLRTFAGGAYQGGYSDHFPVYLYLVKEVK